MAEQTLQSIGLTPERAALLIEDALSDGVTDDELQQVDATGRVMIRAHNRPGDHPGGGESGSSGGSSGGSASAKTHSVKLPKNKTKITTAQTTQALGQMGYKLGRASSAVSNGKLVTKYSVTRPDGSTVDMSTDDLKSLVYDGAAK